MITSLYISMKLEFVGTKNSVGERLGHVESAWPYVGSLLEEATDRSLLRCLVSGVDRILCDCDYFLDFM
jgi:hypothetical protein